MAIITAEMKNALTIAVAVGTMATGAMVAGLHWSWRAPVEGAKRGALYDTTGRVL